MKKTIAIMACADTKSAEMDFLRKVIEDGGMKALTIDISSRGGYEYNADISADQVARAAGSSAEEVFGCGVKADALTIMCAGSRLVVRQLVENKEIDGILGFGGLQNSMNASNMMRELPVGFPKMILSTVACGGRPFSLLAGNKDIGMMPSIADIAGVNPITSVVLRNAAAAVMGMVQYGGKGIENDGGIIAATMMGATNDGIANAVKMLERDGRSVITFHSTGIGGSSLEELIRAGSISACMDLSTHEIVSQDVIGAGFSAGAENRLCAAAETGIPLLMAPGGMDFVDFTYKEFMDGALGDPNARKYTLHNKDTVHVKLFPDEAARGAEIAVERLNRHPGPVAVLMPLQGLRSESRPGGRMHDPAVDEAIFDVFREKLRKDIPLCQLDAHLFDMEFSVKAYDMMNELLKNQ